MIARALSRGLAPECGCLGRLSSGVVGKGTLYRNGLLAAAAGTVLWWGPGRGLGEWLSDLGLGGLVGLAGIALTLSIVGLGGWLMGQLIRQNGRMLLRVEALERRLAALDPPPPRPPSGLPAGTPAPDFTLEEMGGSAVALRDLRRDGKRVLLLFVDPACPACETTADTATEYAGPCRRQLMLALVSSGTARTNREWLRGCKATLVLLQRDKEVAAQYRVEGVPSAVLILPDGRIGSPLAEGSEAVRELIALAVRGCPVEPPAG